jgi:hypothetical protein
MVRIMNEINDHQFYNFIVSSKKPHSNIFDLKTNSRHDYNNDSGVLTMESWCWVEWKQYYSVYLKDVHFSVYLRDDRIRYPVLLFQDADVYLKCAICAVCGKDADKRMVGLTMRGRNNGEFLACRSHVGFLVENGVICQTDKMYYEVRRWNVSDVMEDSMSIRSSMCE